LECQKKREEEDGKHNSPSHQKITKTKTKQNPKEEKKKTGTQGLQEQEEKENKTSRKNRPGGCGSWVSSRRAQAQRQAIHG
jgi:hypothetical protein